MTIEAAALPDDPDELRVYAHSLQQELQARDAELYAKTLHIEKLKAQLAALRRSRYGRSSEKLDRDIEQLELMIGDLEEGNASRAERQQAEQRSAEGPQRQDVYSRCAVRFPLICRGSAWTMKRRASARTAAAPI